MTVSIDPVLIGLHDGDAEPNRNDTARVGFARLNSNEQNIKTARRNPQFGIE